MISAESEQKQLHAAVLAACDTSPPILHAGPVVGMLLGMLGLNTQMPSVLDTCSPLNFHSSLPTISKTLVFSFLTLVHHRPSTRLFPLSKHYACLLAPYQLNPSLAYTSISPNLERIPDPVTHSRT